ncbi:hypothetical protein UFOVP453_26 [uncultured Caudovirales phage]|uniref:Uncharacterized protein n=1 Tax=uncultured Caudovirales phage TaxID=2100421 RepID=A0A6J5MCC6_9CAUD|nr:hypothetical protein UFOVP453_26 [uncultured Caudovirales phage]
MQKEKMLVRLRDVAYVFASNIVNARDLREGKESARDYLKRNAGNWIEIDTACLFENQYNSVDGFRIYDTMIDAVKNDARIGMSKCAYCGRMEPYTPDAEQAHADCLVKMNAHIESYNGKRKMTHILKPFTERNTFFLTYPELPIMPAIEEIKIDKALLFHIPSLNHYRFMSGRKTIDFLFDPDAETFYTENGIGYTRTKLLDVAYPRFTKILKHLKEQTANIATP